MNFSILWACSLMFYHSRQKKRVDWTIVVPSTFCWSFYYWKDSSNLFYMSCWQTYILWGKTLLTAFWFLDLRCPLFIFFRLKSNLIDHPSWYFLGRCSLKSILSEKWNIKVCRSKKSSWMTWSPISTLHMNFLAHGCISSNGVSSFETRFFTE